MCVYLSVYVYVCIVEDEKWMNEIGDYVVCVIVWLFDSEYNIWGGLFYKRGGNIQKEIDYFVYVCI